MRHEHVAPLLMLVLPRVPSTLYSQWQTAALKMYFNTFVSVGEIGYSSRIFPDFCKPRRCSQKSENIPPSFEKYDLTTHSLSNLYILNTVQVLT